MFEDQAQWDYIIIGAGSAGCVLANRLSANPQNRVLLIEAGGSDRNPLQRIPVATIWLNLGNPRRDWRYMTAPDPSRSGRRELWSRGRMIGGSSSVNGMIYVRGAREDYDRWAQLGNVGWAYDDLLPIFRRMETNELAARPGPHQAYYGTSGPLSIRPMKGPHPLCHAFVEACASVGIPRNDDYNAAEQEGACILSLNQGKRIRHSSAQVYLEPIKHRRNLTIIKDCHVARLLISERRVSAIEIVNPGKGELRTIAGARIVLSAGSIATPQILMLSGVGPAVHLRDLGIKVRHDLSGVGQNLQDHVSMPVAASVDMDTLSLSPPAALSAAWNWLAHGSGPLMSAGFQAFAFTRTDPALSLPDIQILMMPSAYRKTRNDWTVPTPRTITLKPTVNRPFSRGTIRLASKDFLAHPSIMPNLLADPRDVNTLVAGARLSRVILKAASLARHVVAEVKPGPHVQTDREWEDYARSIAGTSYHHCGTCRMGNDAAAVVGANLKVHGIENLWIADGSIMPEIPSGNINSACMMIGEKASDLLLSTS